MAHPPEEAVHLEGFGESLRGQRAYVVAKNPAEAQRFVAAAMDALDKEVAYRGRKVLVFQHATAAPPRWLARLGWDATFHVRDVQDLKMALTVIQHMTKPGRVVWVGSDPAAQVLGSLQRIEHLTVLAVGERAPTDPFWSAVFWHPDATDAEVESACAARMGGAGQVRAVLRELRTSQLGLVWSSIGESDKRGAIYWFDPTAGEGVKPAIDTGETVEMLRALAITLENGRG